MHLKQRETEVAAALEPAFRDQLLARGQARSIIWRDGVLPDGSPPFIETLSYELVTYGDALLLHAIRIRTAGGDEQLARRAFVRAGEAFEAVVANGVPDDPQRGFLRMLSAAAYHLGHSSARAYSMLVASLTDANLSKLERSLALLILRDLDRLENEIAEWRASGVASDQGLVKTLDAQDVLINDADTEEQFEESILDALDIVLCDQLHSGLGSFLLALQTGEEVLVGRAHEELQTGLTVASDINLVPQWWCFHLAIQLIDDLWQVSFHQLLPQTIPDGDSSAWQEMRNLFIASLYRRRRAEIELWPSQIEGARRAVDISDNLVVSLPTSAGKTRIAELCILRCLSEGKRVVFVTPLRALSAQTEYALQTTFGNLGKSVSGLYGSMGMSAFEEDTLRSREIVVATPEKIDFALRNDPSILDDVGLVILDEGHMIGLGEREVRYEVQIQRLLKRTDANERRIVCLSAILPNGNEFDDFISWLRSDNDGDAVRSNWRPTRLRFGEVLWQGQRARLELRVGEEKPFVPTFIEQKKPLRGNRTQPFPRNQRELVIATAWRQLEDDQSVLIYCPERKSVIPYATAIVDLESKGFIEPALRTDEGVLAETMTIGREWLGNEHPILKCLKLGVAIHHGALPTPFRKEMERLLRNGTLKVTVSSPTLAQGLNLTATSIVMHDIQHYRDGRRKTVAASDFKNIVGRAGRAFVDVEGLILYPIFKNQKRIYLRSEWNELIDSAANHELESGLLLLVKFLLTRLHKSLGKSSLDELIDYVLNNAAAWAFPAIADEKNEVSRQNALQWYRYLAILDTALLSLVGGEELSVDNLSARLDELLASSLWQRRLSRRKEKIQALFREALNGRAKFIWTESSTAQRRGYFLAGVGLSSGQALDALATELNPMLIEANAAIIENDRDRAIDAIRGLAERLFEVEPFVPRPFPDKWRNVLELWLSGESIANVGVKQNDDVLRFVENGLIYKLPWAIDAVRVRARANEDTVDNDGIVQAVDDFETGLVVPCLETGTLNPCAARLMQAGFSSRLAAIKAVTSTNAKFTNRSQLKNWLQSPDVVALSADQSWPTAESHQLWLTFVNQYIPNTKATWCVQSGEFPVTWHGNQSPPEGEIVRLRYADNGECTVLSSAFYALGKLNIKLDRQPAGLIDAKVSGDGSLTYRYRGPKDIVVIE